MNYTKKYAAHLKPFNLSMIAEAIQARPPLSPQSIAFTWLQSSAAVEACVDSLGGVHQQFLATQAHIYQLYIQQHQLLSEQLHQSLAAPQEAMQAMPISPYPGPAFNRAELEELASSDISPLFGEWFKPLDQHAKLIRMPMPPLLLTDKILGIEGVPGSMGKGTIWTETTVTEDAWYLHQGRMPAGVMIESGQSDLLLASWLGFDLYNQGKRVYRLLGCEASYHGELPKVGDTLHYVITIDGHVRQGDIIIFFFHYDCTVNGELRLRVRQGQAGFFSEEELANSGGVLWDATEETYDSVAPLEIPTAIATQQTYSSAQLAAFANGKIANCFGQGFEITDCHTRTPRISAGNMLLIDEITHFDTTGGPGKRGYMRAVQHIHPDDWFFAGHFKNDPCMPGTLILEGALQAMACYLTALGFTLDKDGSRFEPVTDAVYKMRCRGQVIPTSKLLEYEIFVHSVVAGPIPTLIADILCTSDGLKAFHTRCGLKLVPDWPLAETGESPPDERAVVMSNGFRFDYHSLLACALGRPTHAFGEFYQVFDSHRHVARLPAPPYHFMTRITQLDSEMGSFKAGIHMECEYDIPKTAWYFASNVSRVMPFCVLLEAGLQPCGWLASYMGSTLLSPKDMKFRNLEGVATLYADVLPDSKRLSTQVHCTNVSQSAGMIIESFNVKSYAGEQLIFEMATTFGFFPENAFEKQAGIAALPHELEVLQADSDVYLDVASLPRDFFGAALALPAADLLMIDRVTGLWPTQGKQGLGIIRGEKSVKTNDWFFKAHFYQDPVQPGSIGIEAIYHLLQLFIMQQGLHHSFKRARLSPCVQGSQISWKYRGQVVPTNQCVTVLLEVMELNKTHSTLTVKADASLWVDGKKIYTVSNLGINLTEEISEISSVFHDSFVIDPIRDAWVQDHKPNYVSPTLPLMSMADLIARAASKYFPLKKLVRLNNVRVYEWVAAATVFTLHAKILVKDTFAEVTFYREDEKKTMIASGTVHFAEAYESAQSIHIPSLEDGVLEPHPYDKLFHGPAFQCLETLMVGKNGATGILNAEATTVPFGMLNQGLLDGSIHTVPNENLTQWSSKISPSKISLPAFISELKCYQDAPHAGKVRCETRFKGFYHHEMFMELEISLFAGDQLWIQYTLINAFFAKGKLGELHHADRRAFLRDKQYVPAAQLSSITASDKASLCLNDIKEVDWIPGSIGTLYEVQGDYLEMAKQIIMKEYVAAITKVHPAKIKLSDVNSAHCASRPDSLFQFDVSHADGKVTLQLKP